MFCNKGQIIICTKNIVYAIIRLEPDLSKEWSKQSDSEGSSSKAHKTGTDSTLY